MFDLTGKVAVVFGGSGYLGLEFCKSLLEFGSIVYSVDVNIKDNSEIYALKEQYPETFFLEKVDASNKNDLIVLRDSIIEKEKKVDVLVNSTTSKGNDFYLPFEEVSLEGWEIGLLGNLTIPFLATQAFIPIMKERKSGSIINISSIYSIVGNDQRIYEGSNLHEIYTKDSPNIKRIYSHGVYNAAKGGLNAFTRYLAAYYGKDNIRVNTITPGGIYYPSENAEFNKKYSDKVPLGRKANRNEINGAVVFLASDASSYVTGHNLVVDGGYTIW
ncbi:MAG: SDR family oxidoreductase [Melioribacteraceae bacterium]|jgi:NAD(P)-dependent dehydrogenase (short-subunit alcohol dehydrogenase family)|nr:MAG: SDR family oxidoreductase [Melioribacteraceae bacterium]